MVHVNFNEMSNWSRSMLVPLAIINHFKPTRCAGQAFGVPASAGSKVTLDELYPAGYHERDLALPRDPRPFTLRNFLLWLDRFHKWIEENRCARSANWPSGRRSGGCSNASKAATAWRRFSRRCSNSLIALKALRYPDDHPQVRRARMS